MTGAVVKRRSLLIGGVATAVVAATSRSASAASASSGDSETDQLNGLYKKALAEGGDLTVYAGGDTPHQQDPVRDFFLQQFPGISLNLVVDLSKVHAARIDAQISARKVIADVAELQVLDVFPRWKSEHSLLHYRPIGSEHVVRDFKDPDGFYTGVVLLTFANVTSNSLDAAAPVEAEDFLRPGLRDKLIFTYPNDDDAVLFFFKQLVDAYGWSFMERLIAQRPQFVRGTAASAAAVYGGAYEATFATFASLQEAPGATATFTLPRHSPFVSWPQTAAILAQAPHPAAARLYTSWLLSRPVQAGGQTFPIRSDVPNPPGYRSIFDYANTDPTAFGTFLSDRAAVDRFKARIQLYVGDVHGPSPTGVLGFYPGAFRT